MQCVSWSLDQWYLPLNPDHPREDFVRERQVLLPEVQLEDVPEHGRLLPKVGGGVSVGA